MNTAFGLEAKLHYFSGTYRILSAGDYVRCAVTGATIPLAQLRYWNADRQEAYLSAEVATRRFLSLMTQGAQG